MKVLWSPFIDSVSSLASYSVLLQISGQEAIMDNTNSAFCISFTLLNQLLYRCSHEWCEKSHEFNHNFFHHHFSAFILGRGGWQLGTQLFQKGPSIVGFYISKRWNVYWIFLQWLYFYVSQWSNLLQSIYLFRIKDWTICHFILLSLLLLYHSVSIDSLYNFHDKIRISGLKWIKSMVATYCFWCFTRSAQN